MGTLPEVLHKTLLRARRGTHQFIQPLKTSLWADRNVLVPAGSDAAYALGRPPVHSVPPRPSAASAQGSLPDGHAFSAHARLQQQLGALHGVLRGALADLVAAHEEVQALH
jgi:hypothetical protein